MGGGRRKPRHEAPRPSDSSEAGRCRAPCASATGSEPVAAGVVEVDLVEELAAVDLSSWAAPCVLPTSVLGSTDSRRGEVVLMEHANVFECPVVVKNLAPLRQTFEKLRPVAGSPELLRCERKAYTFHVERPSWKSDIAWIAANDAATFRGFFQAAFEQLGVARLFGFLGEMVHLLPNLKPNANPNPDPDPNPNPDPHQVLFSGFFVSRRATHKSHFHTDFNNTANLAFTLMTPLYDMSALPDCQLLCKAPDGAVQQYRYALGRAIVFGDSFVHATETGVAPRALAFLCFTFGDRRTLTLTPTPANLVNSYPNPDPDPNPHQATGA